MIKTMSSGLLTLLLGAPVLAQSDTEAPSAAEVARAEGVLRYRLTTCRVEANLRPYAELLSKRAMQAIVLDTSFIPEVIESYVNEGVKAATDAAARKPADWACSDQDMQCLLAFFEERDIAIREILGVASLVKPQEWPVGDPSCDDEDGEASNGEAATPNSHSTPR